MQSEEQPPFTNEHLSNQHKNQEHLPNTPYLTEAGKEKDSFK